MASQGTIRTEAGTIEYRSDEEKAAEALKKKIEQRVLRAGQFLKNKVIQNIGKTGIFSTKATKWEKKFGKAKKSAAKVAKAFGKKKKKVGKWLTGVKKKAAKAYKQYKKGTKKPKKRRGAWWRSRRGADYSRKSRPLRASKKKNATLGPRDSETRKFIKDVRQGKMSAVSAITPMWWHEHAKTAMETRYRATKVTMHKVAGRTTYVMWRGKPGREKAFKVVQHSKLGEFPRAITKDLMRSVYRGDIEHAGNVTFIRVGTKKFYGKILELTSRSNRRPYLRRTLKEETPEVVKILRGKATGSVKK